jgi:hypothetical protein
VREFGNFEATRSEIVAGHAGLWSIVGNAPVGNVDQVWLDAFLTPDLERTGKAGLHALGLNEYFYFWPGFLMNGWVAQNNAVLPADTSTLPPVPEASPDDPVEAWLAGRFQWTMKLPRWWPVFFPEGGADRIAPHQVAEWDAPRRGTDQDGEPIPFAGINTLVHRIKDKWADATDGARYYAHSYLGWLHDFYAQFEQVYGVAHFGAGPHYTHSGEERPQFEDYDIDRHGAGAVLRSDIAGAGWTQVVPPWEYAAHVLGQGEPPTPDPGGGEPPSPPPDDPPAPPEPAPLLERLQGLALSNAFWGHAMSAAVLAIAALLDVEPDMVHAAVRDSFDEPA